MLRDILLSEKPGLKEAIEEHFHFSPGRAEDLSNLAIDYIGLELEAEVAKGNWSPVLNILNGKEEVVNSVLAQNVTVKLAMNLMDVGKLSPSEATSVSQFFISCLVHQIHLHLKGGLQLSDFGGQQQKPIKKNLFDSWLGLKDKLSQFFK